MINHVQWLAELSLSDLSDRAVRIANALALVYLNRETGRCNPSRKTLAERLRVSEDTVKRALRELQDRGWIVLVPGRWRSSPSSFQMVMPSGNVVALTPRGTPAETAPRQKLHPRHSVTPDTVSPHKGVQICPAKGRKSAPTPGANLPPLIVNQNKINPSAEPEARARPCPHLRVTVWAGSDRHQSWNEWLRKQGLPSLYELPRLRRGQGFELLHGWPAKEGSIEEAMDRRLIEWAMAGEDQGGGQRHAG